LLISSFLTNSKLRPDHKLALAQELPYEARIKAARGLLSALAEVVQGRVPKAAPPPKPPVAAPKAPAAPAKKNVFGRPVVPPPAKGATTKPIPFPGRWKR
jgi:hypothetical protein